MSFIKPKLTMKQVLFIIIIFLTYSCIPLRIAPNIKDDKVMIAKKFKRKLPKQYAFIFEDPKEANEFYNYINIKFQLDHKDVDWDIPITINNESYYMSFYETEIPNKTLNLIPVLIDAKRESNGNDPLLEELHITRKGKWFLVLTVIDIDNNDCLKESHKSRKEIINYLKQLKAEYLSLVNYYEALFSKKS